MSLSRAFFRELRGALCFASVVGAIVAALSVAVFNVEARLHGVVTSTFVHVAVAGFMPAFFAGWIFFLRRRQAWRSAGRAFVLGSALAAAGFVAHALTLHSGYHHQPASWATPLSWVDGVVHGGIFQFLLLGSAASVVPSALLGCGVGLGLALLQRSLFTRRSAP